MRQNNYQAGAEIGLLSVFQVESSDVNKLSVAELGGKAYGLLRISQAGFPIPRTLVIPVKEFEVMIQEVSIGRFIECNDNDLMEYILNLESTIELGNTLNKILKEWDRSTFAVRSSAVAEDGSQNSFAGIMHTDLQVEKKDVLRSVAACWTATQSLAVKSYAKMRNIESSYLPTAVIVQEMLTPDAAGVCFTVDPMNPTSDYLIVEVVRGLGTGVVDGSEIPERLLVCKHDLSVETSLKSKWLNSKVSQSQIISNSQLRRLSKMAVSLSAIWRQELDLEFALESQKVFLLQARPITALAK